MNKTQGIEAHLIPRFTTRETISTFTANNRRFPSLRSTTNELQRSLSHKNTIHVHTYIRMYMHTSEYQLIIEPRATNRIRGALNQQNNESIIRISNAKRIYLTSVLSVESKINPRIRVIVHWTLTACNQLTRIRMFLELDHETLMELVSIERGGGDGGGGPKNEWKRLLGRNNEAFGWKGNGERRKRRQEGVRKSMQSPMEGQRGHCSG